MPLKSFLELHDQRYHKYIRRGASPNISIANCPGADKTQKGWIVLKEYLNNRR